MSAVNRNPRRRATYIEAARKALAEVPMKGDQRHVFGVEVKPAVKGFPTSGMGYIAIGYADLLNMLVQDIVHLERGQTITIRLPTVEEERFSRKLLREHLEIEGRELLDAADLEALGERRKEIVADDDPELIVACNRFLVEQGAGA